MAGRLEGRTAVVTGSGRNIGKAIVLAFAAEGANIVVNGHSNSVRVEEVVAEAESMGARAMGLMADVSDPEAVRQLVQDTLNTFGSIDIAVSNVGQRNRQPFSDISIQDWDTVIRTNLSSAFYLAHYALPAMKDGGWGRIIHISGYDGWTGHIGQRAHNVTAKAGMHALAKAIAREYGTYGITANTVAPGAIRTERDPEQYRHIDFNEVLGRLAIKHAGEPEDIAQACVYLAGESGRFITGQVIHVNGGEFMF